MTREAKRVAVLVVEDDAWVREGVSFAITRAESGLECVGAAASGAEAASVLRGGAAPQVALIDIGLPDMSGIDLILGLRASRPEICVLVFSISDDPPTILNAIRAGAQGYLLKSTPMAGVLEGLREAANGGSPMTPSVARLVVEEMRRHRDDVEGRPEEGLAALTKRETEILVLLAKGLTYARAGEILGIALGTVQWHVKHIYEKLQVDSKAEAATAALRMGLV